MVLRRSKEPHATQSQFVRTSSSEFVPENRAASTCLIECPCLQKLRKLRLQKHRQT